MPQRKQQLETQFNQKKKEYKRKLIRQKRDMQNSNQYQPHI